MYITFNWSLTETYITIVYIFFSRNLHWYCASTCFCVYLSLWTFRI